jgi:hypothetical protein
VPNRSGFQHIQREIFRHRKTRFQPEVLCP